MRRPPSKERISGSGGRPQSIDAAVQVQIRRHPKKRQDTILPISACHSGSSAVELFIAVFPAAEMPGVPLEGDGDSLSIPRDNPNGKL